MVKSQDRWKGSSTCKQIDFHDSSNGLPSNGLPTPSNGAKSLKSLPANGYPHTPLYTTYTNTAGLVAAAVFERDCSSGARRSRAEYPPHTPCGICAEPHRPGPTGGYVGCVKNGPWREKALLAAKTLATNPKSPSSTPQNVIARHLQERWTGRVAQTHQRRRWASWLFVTYKRWFACDNAITAQSGLALGSRRITALHCRVSASEMDHCYESTRGSTSSRLQGRTVDWSGRRIVAGCRPSDCCARST